MSQIQEIPKTERPRERLKRLGADVLRSDELLAVILGSGSQKDPVLKLAAELLKKFGSVQGLALASLEELQSISGIGIATALKIKAAFALSQRVDSPVQEQVIVKSPKDAFLAARPYIQNEKREFFLTVLLDVRNQIIAVDVISIGTLTGTLVHPREVFLSAIKRNAHALIAVHNHPSQDLTPSSEDIETTKQLIDAAHLMNIPLLDHLIISRDHYYSFKENGFHFFKNKY
jgi:DNA repair protein RadC